MTGVKNTNLKKRAPASCGGAPTAESRDAFVVKQLQTLFKIKILLLCDSDLKCITTTPL